ncbi:MAG: hypothetical protein ACOZQL_35480 [Myxococcota bacterium]
MSVRSALPLPNDDTRVFRGTPLTYPVTMAPHGAALVPVFVVADVLGVWPSLSSLLHAHGPTTPSTER